MTFLNTAILFGLIAGAIPIIIHLITRQKAKTVIFSSLRFLKELKNQQIRKIKIKQILLLIIRTLIILLIILAFARPTFIKQTSSSANSTARTSAVLILDNSMSMAVESEGLQLFDVAKRKVQELGGLFSVGDEIFGIFASTGASSIYEGPKYDFQNVNKIVQKLKVNQSGSDILTALVKAKQLLLESSNINKEIYIISDFQESAFQNQDELLLPIFTDENIKIFFIQVQSESSNNLVLANIKATNQIIEKDKVFELDANIRNTGSKNEKNKLVQIFLDGKRSGQASVSLKPGESTSLKFRVVPKNTGFNAGSALIEEDDLLPDNRRFFSFYVPEQNNVLLIGEKESDIQFIKLALNPEFENASRIAVDYMQPNKIEFNTLKKYQVVILSNLSRIEGALLTALESHVQSGGGLIIFLGNDVDLRNYNENINAKLGLPLFTETVGEIGKRQPLVSLGKVDYSHPIFSGVFETSQKEIESPQFYFFTKLKVRALDEKIIEFSNGDPFLLECKSGQGKVMQFTSAINPNWSDLYLRGIFVPLLNRSVAYLAGSTRQEELSSVIGEELTANINNVDDVTNLEIEKPDGKRTKVIPQISEGNYKINFSDTDKAGIYSLFDKSKLLTQWAVNFNPDESNIQKMDEAKYKDIVGDKVQYFIINEDKFVDNIIKTRYGNELWKYLVGLVLLLLIIEMLIAREPQEQESEVVLKSN